MNDRDGNDGPMFPEFDPGIHCVDDPIAGVIHVTFTPADVTAYQLTEDGKLLILRERPRRRRPPSV